MYFISRKPKQFTIWWNGVLLTTRVIIQNLQLHVATRGVTRARPICVTGHRCRLLTFKLVPPRMLTRPPKPTAAFVSKVSGERWPLAEKHCLPASMLLLLLPPTPFKRPPSHCSNHISCKLKTTSDNTNKPSNHHR